MLIDPLTAGSTTTTKVFAATSFGLYRSTNSGSSWTQVVSSAPVTDLVIDPSNANTFYAAVGNIFGGANNGVYKSTDAGSTWIKLAGGLPTTNVGRINLAVTSAAPGTVYASVQNTSDFTLRGIWKSADAGTSWIQLTASGASCASQCWYDMHINVSPADPNAVFFGGLSLYRSTDGGSNFTDIGAPQGVHVDHHG